MLMNQPYERNGVLILKKENLENEEYVQLDYRGFKVDFENRKDLTDEEIIAYKNGVLTAVNSIFNRLPELEKEYNYMSNVRYEDLLVNNDYLTHTCIPKRNVRNFVQNKNYPCSLPKNKNGKIVSVVMNSEGEYVDIPVSDENFTFCFNDAKI